MSGSPIPSPGPARRRGARRGRSVDDLVTSDAIAVEEYEGGEGPTDPLQVIYEIRDAKTAAVVSHLMKQYNTTPEEVVRWGVALLKFVGDVEGTGQFLAVSDPTNGIMRRIQVRRP